MIFRWFERLVDPFADGSDEMPPQTLTAFYAHYLRPIAPILAALLVLGLLVALIEVLLFDFLSTLIDWTQAAASPQVFFDEHAAALAAMAVTALLLRPLFNVLHDLLVHQAIEPGLTARMFWQQHRYVLQQSLSFFQNDFAGRIATRILQTAPALRESAVQIVDAIWYIVVYVSLAGVLFVQANVWLLLPLLFWVAGYLLLLRLFVPRLEARSAVASESRSRLGGRVVDGYTNALTLKLFAHSEREQQYAREAIADFRDDTQRMTRTVTAMDFAMTVHSGLLIVGTPALALWLWRRGLVSTGDIALATALVIRIVNMSDWILWTVTGIFESIGTVHDGMHTIAQPRQVTDRADAMPLRAERGEIRFDDIRFHYGRQGGVIEGLSLSVRAGERIGLVGPSGAGKTTLGNLLLRLYDLEGGHIRIDGQDIATVTQQSLRRQIGVVTQDSSLLHRSIRDNLLYGRPDADDAAIAEALRRAQADGFVHALVDGEGRRGLDAHVGERGVKLSGGQRQRIAIARVLLKNAPILLLDEATSALDSEVEAAIQASLDELMQGKTVIAIAHRLSTIARMDRLVVLQQGRIVETGTHAELLEAGGLYARLWNRQVGGFMPTATE
ncbi:ABC transporter ATP-binding protein [Hydrocarboniphaga effusa]|jgi:ATP-binding cassette subfamily B multidrug efflux pump|uniref:ABC transporter ATP-binding protein n=1 Tax=Hydrocarboniphaga effusa TaxID=243629 RepID=UPI00313837AD